MYKIGIIGAGMIGATAARLFADAGHEVAVSNSRGPDSLAGVVAQLGPREHAAAPAEAARWGDIARPAGPWRTPEAPPADDAAQGTNVHEALDP